LITAKEPLSYSPAGSSAVTLSVVPIVRVPPPPLPPEPPLLLLPPLPPPQAARVSAATATPPW
jgi:hypothetical protein